MAYSAGSLWTAPAETDGIVGALTRTKSESTVAAVRAILEVMEEMRESPPTEDEVSTAVDAASNGFGFNFQSPTQIVSRLMLFRARDLPDDWLERYVDRIQGVSPVDVRDVLRPAPAPRKDDDSAPRRPVRVRRAAGGARRRDDLGGRRARGCAPPQERSLRPSDAGSLSLERRDLYFTPTWMAAIPRLRRLQRASRNPASRIRSARGSGPGKSRTEAGR